MLTARIDDLLLPRHFDRRIFPFTALRRFCKMTGSTISPQTKHRKA